MDKNKIIEAAFKLIVSNGLEEFSIAKLANELNCTKSSIYNYFKSKDDLLNSVFVSKTTALNTGIDINSDPEQVIRQYAHNCVANYEVFIFFHKYAHSNFINKDTMCEVKKDFDLAKVVVDNYVAKYAKSSNVNPIIYEALIFGPIHGLMMRGKISSTITDEDIDLLVDHILSTLRKEDNERNN
ncbi:TetR/AcrR family transcriptional regulator [Mollicutes bacterium LVI A0039]|nr:TetR/AcrR family transcriptional regulator [Mollicutes bacterium LVI A0039]